MTDDLRSELHNLADAESLAPLDSDLWERGRATRRTARLQLIAASIVGLACLAASIALLRPVIDTAPAAGPETDGALPAVVHTPEGPMARWSARDPSSNEGERDFASIGRISAAAVKTPYLPLLVGASDGTHHVVDLPDKFDLALTPSGGVVPSPDGWKVAYVWATPSTDTKAGVAWVDLRTGVTTQIRVRGEGGHPVLVTQLSWSADGAHLAWLGDEIEQWHESGGMRSDRSPIEVGTIEVEDETEPRTWTVPQSDRGAAVAVDDEGSPYVVAGRRLWRFGEVPYGRLVVERGEQVFWSTATLGTDGHLVIGRNTQDMWHERVVGTGELDVTAARPRMVFRQWGDAPRGSVVEPLGITDDGEVVAAVRHRNGIATDPARIEMRAADDTVITLTRWTGSAQASLTVAVGLADDTVVEFPEPTWPLETSQIVARVGLAAVALLLAGGCVVLLVRRRRTRP